MAEKTQKFRLQKDDHIIETTLPVEAVTLRAAGYRDVKKPGPKPSTATTTADKK